MVRWQKGGNFDSIGSPVPIAMPGILGVPAIGATPERTVRFAVTG